MSKRNNLFLCILIIFITNAIAVKINNTNYHRYPIYERISDSPIIDWQFLDFLKNYNQHNKLLILQSLSEYSLIDMEVLIKEGKNLIEFKSIDCLPERKCKIKNNIKYSIDLNIFKQEFMIELRKNHIFYQTDKDSIFYFLFFDDTSSIENVNSDKKNGFTSRLYLNQNKYQSWLSIINKYDSIKLEKELDQFYIAIKSPQCIDKTSPYCFIKNNNKNKIIAYINQYKNTPKKNIKLSLLLDYAYKSNNSEMSKLFTEMELDSIHFPDNRTKLYAATYFDYSNIVNYLIIESKKSKKNHFDINSEFTTGLTFLDVALFSYSYESLKLLLKNGAYRKGSLAGLYQSNKKFDKSIKYKIFEIYHQEFKNKETPDIFRGDLVGFVAVRGENILQWFNELYKEDPQLFKSVFIDSDEYAHRAILKSGLRETPEMFDFLMNHGVDLCLAFDKRSMEYFKYYMEEDNSHWLNSRYKQYQNKCEKKPGNK